VSLKNALLKAESSGIIAEFKRKSPSKGIINKDANVEFVTTGYVRAGAAALSVLTDNIYFGGSNNDLLKAREMNVCPILRKEFIIDEYQIYEAKSIGADVILLIAAYLEKQDIMRLASVAKSLQLEVLLELHDESEVEKISSEVDLVGINNRNLKNFNVDIEQSLKLASRIPDNYVKIAESGISSPDEVKNFRKAGFKGFLMGERFMKTENPEKACEEFIKQLK
jgi:indole-3-glycerol phosphate synthase